MRFSSYHGKYPPPIVDPSNPRGCLCYVWGSLLWCSLYCPLISAHKRAKSAKHWYSAILCAADIKALDCRFQLLSLSWVRCLRNSHNWLMPGRPATIPDWRPHFLIHIPVSLERTRLTELWFHNGFEKTLLSNEVSIAPTLWLNGTYSQMI